MPWMAQGFTFFSPFFGPFWFCCYYQHTSRRAVSPVCRIFCYLFCNSFFLLWFLFFICVIVFAPTNNKTVFFFLHIFMTRTPNMLGSTKEENLRLLHRLCQRPNKQKHMKHIWGETKNQARKVPCPVVEWANFLGTVWSISNHLKFIVLSLTACFYIEKSWNVQSIPST